MAAHDHLRFKRLLPGEYLCNTSAGCYMVDAVTRARCWRLRLSVDYGEAELGFHPTCAEAKRAAEADYHNRIGDTNES